MFKKCALLIIGFFMAGIAFAQSASTGSGYAGYWVTYDGKHKQARSIVKFTQMKNRVIGKGYVTFYTNKMPEKYCVKCKGKYHNKPVMNIPFFTGTVVPNKKQQPCKIFDTNDGKKYNCYFYLKNQGKILLIRVYLGTPMFGRTLEWRRAPQKLVEYYKGKKYVRIKKNQ